MEVFETLTSFAPRILCETWECPSVPEGDNFLLRAEPWFVFGTIAFIHMLGFYPFIRKLRATPKFSKWRLRLVLPLVSLAPSVLLTGIIFNDAFDYGGETELVITLGLICLPAIGWAMIVLDPIVFPLDNFKHISRGPTLEILLAMLLCLPLVGPAITLLWWVYSLGMSELFGYLPMERAGRRRHLKWIVLGLLLILIAMIFV